MTDQVHYFICPHPECGGMVEVPPNQLNCKIFRHGIFKSNGKQIPPHLEKDKCDALYNQGKIYGCGKPFLLKDSKPVICDYI